jgi:hypothetical protein
MNLPQQQIISDQEWSIWIADQKITGDTLNTVRRHIQETEMSKWLAAPRKNGENQDSALHVNSSSTPRQSPIRGRTSCMDRGNG